MVPRVDAPPEESWKCKSGAGAGRGVCAGGGRLWVMGCVASPLMLEMNWEAFTRTVCWIFRFTVCFASWFVVEGSF